MTKVTRASLSLPGRKEILAKVPWVKTLATHVRCEAYRWSDMPLRALYPWGPGNLYPPVGKDKWRCKKMASWHFTASKRSRATSGNYCWHHIMYSGISHDEIEFTRFDRWYANYQEKNR
jgi:hypothetical protein